MKLVIIIAIAFVLLIPIPVFAQDVYIQIDELPEWAGYASNVMYLSTEAWKEANEGLEFYIVDSGSDFTVKWVKEFGGEYVGYAYGNQFIEVGLGDSNCGNQWNPYSERYISHIMKHEIGHIFGHEHNNNPNSIMYPVALNQEYGIVEENYRLTEGYGQFVQFCTIKDLTSYEFSISTTDETYGFDYYIVPSSNEFVKWSDGKTFQHYSNNDCFGEGWLSISGTCKGISTGSGIIILMDSELTSPLVTITVKQSEHQDLTSSKSSLTSKLITIEQEYTPPVFDTEFQIILLENQIKDLEEREISLESLIKKLELVNKRITEQSEEYRIKNKDLKAQIASIGTTVVHKELGIALFVDGTKDPQYYIDRYNNESSYKKWFDDNYPEYDSIEQAVGLELTQKIPSWIKSIFGLYSQDQISEDELLNAIKYLIDEGILVVE